ncbi:MAG: hypothetical protein IJX54_01000, partial [Oscillospiraceae bacterium]|nr:hypothetical protein [Oscillospiraceae bacterium]
MKELWAKIREALVSALPITLIVYLVALLPGFSFNRYEIISFTIGAVMLVLGIGLFNMGEKAATARFNLDELGLPLSLGKTITAKDIWTGEDAKI